MEIIDLTNRDQNSEIKVIESENEEDENSNIFITDQVTDQVNDDLNTLSTDQGISLNNSSNKIDKLSTIWENSNKEEIIFLLEKLDNNIFSKIIKSYIIDFLVYGTVPPKNMSQEDFDKFRVLTLKNLNDFDAAITVISSINTYDSHNY